MDLYAHATLQLWQEHPRDILWFDLYADQRVRNAAISAAAKSSDEQHCSLNLMLESTFTSSSGCKQPPLSEARMERQIIDGLRQEASITATAPLKQALRCLATCMDNYARHGSEDAVCRVIALAEALNLNHDSQPYRIAFGETRRILDRLLQNAPKGLRPSSHELIDIGSVPDRVYYFAVLNTCSKRMPPLRIRLFKQERHAIACLTDWLKQYGIPYEVWRSLRSIMADEHLPYMQDGLYATIGEKTIHS